MSFGPKKIEFQEILINSLGSLIAGIVGSVVILLITFLLGNSVNIPGTFAKAQIGIETSSIFPLILSIITLIGTTITIFLTYKLLNMTSNERYKKNIVIAGQLAFFAFLTYLFVTPIYIYSGLIDYDYIMYVFLFHTLIVIFGTSIIIELLNNYRHILIGLYGSFIGLFTSSILTVLIFTSLDTGIARLISLVVLIPVINFSTTFFKQLFQLAYYHYYNYTNLDQLGDIFYQIELEEKEILREEEEKNSI
ncbi:hypothetical protein LRZ95_00410 [Candidatus Gracilibacteria bacterium]|nr:hypothetical protein [Candidatus Gracilibacteria bacterium]